MLCYPVTYGKAAEPVTPSPYSYYVPPGLYISWAVSLQKQSVTRKDSQYKCEFCNGLKSIEYMDPIYTRDKTDSSKDQMFSFSYMEISSQACPHGNVLCHPINQIRKDFKLVATCLF